MLEKASTMKKFPWHIFLLPIFFVWHILNDHFALIPFSYWGRFVLYFIALALFFFLIGKLLLKNMVKAGCWCTGFLIIFFFWGSAHDFLKSLHPISFILSYKFLLPLILILLITFFVVLRKKSIPYRMSGFLTLLFSLFLLIEASTSIYKFINKEHLKNDLAYYSAPVSITKAADSQKPDIFFIVFDEYASTPALKKYLSYDNSALDSLLLKKNFFVATNSKSNYDITPVSIASTFNLQYFNVPLEGIKSTRADLLKYQQSLKKSLIPQFLTKEGYTIINHGICDLPYAPAPHEPYFNRFINGALYGETLWGRIRKEIAWNLPAGIWDWSFMETGEKQDDGIEINSTNFNAILKELQSQSEKPKFVYGHLMLPHTPYYVDKFGKKRKLSILDIGLFNDSLYIDQLIYTNTLLNSLAQAGNMNFPRPRVIILEGDHGNRRLNLPKNLIARDRQFMNLNSYYFSDKDYTSLYKSISPVNSFRVVLNKYFHAELPLLKDSTILLLE